MGTAITPLTEEDARLREIKEHPQVDVGWNGAGSIDFPQDSPLADTEALEQVAPHEDGVERWLQEWNPRDQAEKGPGEEP